MVSCAHFFLYLNPEYFQIYIALTPSFSIGYIFYYWKLYKHKGVNKRKQSYNNKNDHSGYEPNELYIEPKYKNIKEEILNNEIYYLLMTDWDRNHLKALKYVATVKAKNMVSSLSSELRHHYGIPPGTSLGYEQLLSIVLYCDNTELSAKFSSTFRKLEPIESIEYVKKRNREYAIWSKTLRETVEYFGQMGWDYNQSGAWNKDNNRIKGPFFCGMSKVMVPPEINIR